MLDTLQVPKEVPLPAPIPAGPQPITPLSCASVTDPDTRATVTTRSDLVMIIDYVTGDKVVQDSDGTRVTSYASGGFRVESAGLPDVRGGLAGVTVEPIPGNVPAPIFAKLSTLSPVASQIKHL